MTLVARVVPNVTGLDKSFDYSIPDSMASRVSVGAIVRVELHGRRIGGWVEEILDSDAAAVDAAALKAIAKVTGHGPDASIFDLARWAAVRWAARRARPFLVAASPSRAVPTLPQTHRSAVRPGPTSPATTALLDAGGGVLRLPPRADPLPAILSTAAVGPALVVVPSIDDVRVLARRLRDVGHSVAVAPDEWAAAAAGVDIVIGTRRAAWAPCPDLAAAIVVDEHDEALQDERSPTWHARDVAVERCRRANVPVVLLSPTPTITALHWADQSGLDVVHPPPRRERAGWPTVTVVDRSDDEPWKKSLLTSALIERLRNPDLTVVCVSNITGRARVLACRSCRALIRCERCDAAVPLDADARLACRRCGTERPPVCQSCGGGRFANLRPGVSRLREELEAAAARPVVEVSGADDGPTPQCGVYVGTEAVLHRVPTADVVAFLEFDSEMLSPRMRTTEQALALLVRAGRMAPEVLVQTFVPDHDVLRAARSGRPDLAARPDRQRRELLGLPPFGALASVSGAGADEFVADLDDDAIQVGGSGATGFLVRAADWYALGRALNAAERPKGARLRVEVDPARI